VSAIFINYRREDSAGYAGRLASDLVQRLPGVSIFQDIDRIDPGADFVDSINNALDQSQMVLALIGRGWLNATDKKGQRRLANPGDFVVLELASALKRRIRTIPVLVGGAEMPAAEDLPDAIKDLARRNAHEISDTRWRYDVDQLVGKIRSAMDAAKREAAPAAVAPSDQERKPPPTATRGQGQRFDWIRVGVPSAVVVGLFIWGMAYLLPRFQTEPKPSEVSEPQKAQPERPKTVAEAPKGPSAPPKIPAATEQAPPARSSEPADAFRRPLARPGLSTFRVQQIYSPEEQRFSALETLIKDIAGRPSRLTFEMLPRGAVVPNAGVVAAVAKGTLDAALISPSALYGNHSAFALVDGPPFGPESEKYAAWRNDKEARSVIEEMYAKQRLVGMLCGVTGPHGDISTRSQPLMKVDDLKGLRIRAPGLYFDMFKKVGADVSFASGVSNLDNAMNILGIPTAAISLDPAADFLRLFKDSSRIYMVGQLNGSRGLDLVIALNKWQALNLFAQADIAASCSANVKRMLAEGSAKTIEAIRESKMKVFVLPQSIIGALRDAWSEVRTERSVADPVFARLAKTVTPYESSGQRPMRSAYWTDKR